jgi:hypothetical protein
MGKTLLLLLIIALVFSKAAEVEWLMHQCKLPCQTGVTSFSNHSMGYECMIGSNCLCGEVAVGMDEIKKWSDVQSFKYHGKVYKNPSAEDCPHQSEVMILAIVDGEIVKEVSFNRLANKKVVDKNDFCCTGNCSINQKCNGDSVFAINMRDYYDASNDKFCHFTAFHLSLDADYVKIFEANVEFCQQKVGIAMEPKISLEGSKVTMEAEGKFWARVCGAECIHIVGLGKRVFELPSTFESKLNSTITVEVISQGKSVMKTFESKLQYGCENLHCTFCKEFWFNYECSKTLHYFFWVMSFWILVFIILTCYKRSYKHAHSFMRKFRRVKTAYNQVQQNDSEQSTSTATQEEELMLRSLRPRKVFTPLTVITLLLLLTVAQACDISFLTEGSCTDQDCKASYDIRTITGDQICLTTLNKTIRVNLDHTKLEASTKRLYYTSEFSVQTHSQNFCYNTKGCAPGWDCSNMQTRNDHNYLLEKKTEDLGLSGCYWGYGGWLHNCVTFPDSCSVWSSFLNVKGEFWEVKKIMAWQPYVHGSVDFMGSIRDLKMTQDSPVTIQIDGVSLVITMLKEPFNIGNMEEYFLLNTRTNEIRLAQSVSGTGVPIGGQIGHLQCTTMNKGLSNTLCIFDHSIVTCSLKGDNAIACTWKEIDLKKVTTSIPMQKGDFMISSGDGHLSALAIQHDEIHLRVEANMDWKLLKENLSCSLKSTKSGGCYNCEAGAWLELEVEGKGNLQLTSSLNTLNQVVKIKEPKTTIPFKSEKKQVKHSLSWKCGANSGVTLLDVSLKYKPVNLEGTVYNMTMDHVNVRDDSWSFPSFSGLFHFDQVKFYIFLVVAFLILLFVLQFAMQILRIIAFH